MEVLIFSKIPKDEIIARKQYYFKAVHNFFYITDCYVEKYNMTKLKSSTSDNIIFMIGHDINIISYLNKNSNYYKNKKIVFISCLNEKNKELNILSKDNLVYLPMTNKNSECVVYKDFYNFGFKPIDEEISLYNVKGSIDQKIDSIFIKFEHGGNNGNNNS